MRDAGNRSGKASLNPAWACLEIPHELDLVMVNFVLGTVSSCAEKLCSAGETLEGTRIRGMRSGAKQRWKAPKRCG